MMSSVQSVFSTFCIGRFLRSIGPIAASLEATIRVMQPAQSSAAIGDSGQIKEQIGSQ